MLKMTVVWIVLALVFFAIVDSDMPSNLKVGGAIVIVCIAVIAGQRHAQSGGSR